MSETTLYVLAFTLLSGVASLIGGVLLLWRAKTARRLSHLLASFAAGTLLGTAYFDLLPEAVELGDNSSDVFLWSVVGILAFFIMARFLHWMHDHRLLDNGPASDLQEPTSALIILGDTVHNFIDGVVIAATFMVSIPLGIVTSVAVAAHEIPQEIGDFGILLHKGMPRRRIITWNVLSSLAAIVGAVITLSLGESIEGFLPMMLALTAGFFTYIAVSDIMPEIHAEHRNTFAMLETLMLVAGVTVVWVALQFLEHSHAH